MTQIEELQDFYAPTREDWRAWLAANHDKMPGVWLVYYKKTSGKPRVSYDEAVEEALCFGWIDSLPRKLDDERSKLLFTPRKAHSVWSRVNKQRIEKLTQNNMMTPVGLIKIEAAQRDGSWNALDASDNLQIPADFARELASNQTAQRNFEAWSDSVKKNILQWILSAKRDQTRRDRIEKTVRMAAANKRALYDKE